MEYLLQYRLLSGHHRVDRHKPTVTLPQSTPRHSFTDFPTPACLNRNFHVGPGSSVYSNVTGTSSRYQQSLISNLSNYSKPASVTRTQWQNPQAHPMSEIKYSADDNAFPPLKHSHKTKSTAAETQAGMTTEVSAISDSIIHSAVKDAFENYSRITTKWKNNGRSSSQLLKPR
jgi:hypothetical protein